MATEVYTDGSCLGNPGPGGWAFIVLGFDAGCDDEHSGRKHATTNNQMELMAAIKALEYLPEQSNLRLYTDSNYLKNGMTQWIEGWKKQNWRKKDKTPVLNVDLWKKLDELRSRHQSIDWQWIKAHSLNPKNERADTLAREQAQKAQNEVRDGCADFQPNLNRA